MRVIIAQIRGILRAATLNVSYLQHLRRSIDLHLLDAFRAAEKQNMKPRIIPIGLGYVLLIGCHWLSYRILINQPST